MGGMVYREHSLIPFEWGLCAKKCLLYIQDCKWVFVWIVFWRVKSLKRSCLILMSMRSLLEILLHGVREITMVSATLWLLAITGRYPVWSFILSAVMELSSKFRVYPGPNSVIVVMEVTLFFLLFSESFYYQCGLFDASISIQRSSGSRQWTLDDSPCAYTRTKAPLLRLLLSCFQETLHSLPWSTLAASWENGSPSSP